MEIGVLLVILCQILLNPNVIVVRAEVTSDVGKINSPPTQNSHGKKNSYSVISEVISQAVNEETSKSK